MKKLLALFVAAAFVVSVVGCGGTNTAPTGASTRGGGSTSGSIVSKTTKVETGSYTKTEKIETKRTEIEHMKTEKVEKIETKKSTEAKTETKKVETKKEG